MFNSSKKEYQLTIYGAGTEYEKIKKYVDRAMARIIQRGLPSPKEIERLKF